MKKFVIDRKLDWKKVDGMTIADFLVLFFKRFGSH
jgi:hypothetical protein